MTWSLGLLAGVSAIPAAIWIGGSLFDKKKSLGRERGFDARLNTDNV
jgi:hypothetical protein